MSVAAKIPRTFLIILILDLFLFAGALSWFFVQYQTNDDAGMNLYAAGAGLNQPPSQFLLFQHFLIGLTLKLLYTYLPQIPWYGALTYAYLFLSSSILGYAISRLNCRCNVVAIWLGTFVLFYLQAIVSPQFTICAGYLALAAVILIYSTVRRPYASGRVNLVFLAVAAVVLVLAGLIRFYSLLLVLLLMAPLYGYALATNAGVTLRRVLPVLCFVCLAAGLLNRINQEYYGHSRGWENFYSYNSVRAEFIDRHKIDWDKNTKPLFERIGWSRNDLAMLESWFYLDAGVYSFEKLEFIAQNTSLLPRAKIDWEKLLSDLAAGFSSCAGLAACLLFILVLINADGRTRSFAVLTLIWCCALFMAVSIRERHLPLRVWLVMLFGFYATELLLWCQVPGDKEGRLTDANSRSSRVISSFLILAFSIAVCWAQLGAVVKVSNSHRQRQTEFRDDLIRLQPRKDQLFVIWGGAFPYEEFQLPTKVKPVDTNFQLLGLGVGNHEPFVQNRLRAFGIDDLYKSFYTRNNVFLICGEARQQLLVRYIKEHYQTDVEIETVFRGATFAVRKVKRIGRI